MRLPGTMVQSERRIIEQSSSNIAGSSISLTCPRLVHPQHWVSATAISGILGVRGPLLVQQFCSRRLRGAKEKSMSWQNMIQSQYKLVSQEKLGGSFSQDFLHIKEPSILNIPKSNAQLFRGTRRRSRDSTPTNLA